MINDFNITQLIERDNLQKHEEGGYFAVTYVSEKKVSLPSYAGGERPESTKINYLLNTNDYSAWHRLKSDEIWRFKAGTSLTLNIINPQGKLEQIKIGNHDIQPDTVNEFKVNKNQWFSAFVTDKSSFSYVECEVRPGFDYRDWQLAKKEYLIKQYPQYTQIIEKYSRDIPANLSEIEPTEELSNMKI